MTRVAKTGAFFRIVITAAAVLAHAGAAHAVSFSMDYGEGIEGTLNTAITAGAAMRMQGRSNDLVGKANLNPTACDNDRGPPFDSRNQNCQGVFRDQVHPARALARAPGQASPNADDGNWNYDKHDLTQAVFKITQDVKVTYGDYGLFVKWLYFYDAINNDFEEFHPNQITRENRASVIKQTNNANSTYTDGVFGAGAPTRPQRRNGEILEQIGTDLQLFDAYVYGTLPLPAFLGDRELTFKVGRQTVNWGESTALVFNSLNQANSVNANNFFRVGFDLSELFMPSGMVFLSTELFEGAAVEAFYGYEWLPLEAPAPGSFYSYNDVVGTDNAVATAGINFGGAAEDPDICGTLYNPTSGCATPQDNPLSGLTNTSVTLRRLEDREAKDGGEFGIAFKYFAEWLNNGTEIGLYFMNYHSKLPYASFFAANNSCARAEESATGMDATNGLELLAACPDLPTTRPADPELATSNAVPIDTVKLQIEYPEDIQMYGISFNTTAGDFSFQGEIAYRPNLPVQVDAEDLVFAALNPMLTRCHNDIGCAGTSTGTGRFVDDNGNFDPNHSFGSSDFVPYPGTGITAYADTFDLGVGHADGSARSFPSFVMAYRGIAPGEMPGNAYIRGWEEFDVYQFNFGGTYIQGATDNPIGADQLIWLFEVGAQWVPDLPDTDELQAEAFGTFYHASAGADGSMTGKYKQDCAHTVDCHFGGDGMRFNPHQQDHDGYADPFSFGYVIVSLIRYESVFPGISFAPFTIWKHDVKGSSVDVAGQFVENRKTAAFLLETRYKEALSFNVGYTWFTGGGQYNPQRDRDQALAYVKYQF